MNYHKNSYTGSGKKKILFRILVVIGALVIVAAATLGYGNYLKNKADETTIGNLAGAGRSTEGAGVGRDLNADAEVSKGDIVKSECVPVESIASAEGVRSYVSRIAGSKCTGITVILVDKDGYLTYDSEAVAAFTHQQGVTKKTNAMIAAAVEQAHAEKLKASAVIFTQNVFAESGVYSEIDALVSSEAGKMGFDEIVAILPVSAEQIDSAMSSALNAYITKLDSNKGSAALGVCFAESVFVTPALSPQLELFASGADFLAIDLTNGASDAEKEGERVTKVADDLTGSFTAYGLRAVFSGGDREIADAEIKALSDKGFENYMFVTATERAAGDETEAVTDNEGNGGGYDNPAPQPPAETPPDQPSPNVPETSSEEIAIQTETQSNPSEQPPVQVADGTESNEQAPGNDQSPADSVPQTELSPEDATPEQTPEQNAGPEGDPVPEQSPDVNGPEDSVTP